VDRNAVWSPDSRDVYWTAGVAARGVSGRQVVYRRPADGSGPAVEVRVFEDFEVGLTDISPDGRRALMNFFTSQADGAFDIKAVSLEDRDAPLEGVATGPGNQFWGTFSPDGNWVAYASLMTGAGEIYVSHFPDTGARWLVFKTQRTRAIRWLRDMSAILVADEGSIVRIPVEIDGASLSVGRPVTLVEDDSIAGQGGWSAAIHPDGTHAYVLRHKRMEGGTAANIVLVTDWLEQVKRLVPGE